MIESWLFGGFASDFDFDKREDKRDDECEKLAFSGGLNLTSVNESATEFPTDLAISLNNLMI
jgi:hypothetical protein